MVLTTVATISMLVSGGTALVLDIVVGSVVYDYKESKKNGIPFLSRIFNIFKTKPKPNNIVHIRDKLPIVEDGERYVEFLKETA